MAQRRKSIVVSILDIKDAGSAARRDVRTDFKSGKGDEVLPLDQAIHVDKRRAGSGHDVPLPKDLPTNAISFCYVTPGNPDCEGMPFNGTVFDFNSISSQYRTQIISSITGSNLGFRTQNGDNNGVWNPWREIFHTGNAPTPDQVGTYSKEQIDNKTFLSVRDARSSAMKPGDYEEKRVNFSFTNQDMPTSNWFSGFTIKGWAHNYGSWQLVSANNYGGGENKLYFRSSVDTETWRSWARVFTTADTPNATDVGLGLVPNTKHDTEPTINTVPLRDASGDIKARLFRSSYPNEVTEAEISGAMAFRINNSTDNYIRFCTNPAAVRRWLGLDVGNTPTFSSLTSLGTIFLLKNSGRRHIAFNNGTGNDLFIYKDPDITPIKINHGVNQLGGGELQILRNGGISIVGRLNRTDESEGTAALRCSPEGGSWESWRSNSSAIQIDCPEAEGSAYNVWKATKWGSAHIAAMRVHLGGNDGGYVKLAVMGADFTFDGTGVFHATGNGNFNDVYIRSDIRLKDNFKRISKASKRIMGLIPCFYDKKLSLNDHKPIKREVGIIAQSLYKNLPEGLQYTKDAKGNDVLGISNSAINGLIVAYLQDLNKGVKKELNEIRQSVGLVSKDIFAWE